MRGARRALARQTDRQTDGPTRLDHRREAAGEFCLRKSVAGGTFTIFSLGEPYRGPNEELWCSTRNEHYHPHRMPVGYHIHRTFANRRLWGDWVEMKITANPDGTPCYTLKMESGEYTGDSPTGPWQAFFTHRRSKERASGPRMIGFSDWEIILDSAYRRCLRLPTTADPIPSPLLRVAGASLRRHARRRACRAEHDGQAHRRAHREHGAAHDQGCAAVWRAQPAAAAHGLSRARRHRA